MRRLVGLLCLSCACATVVKPGSPVPVAPQVAEPPKPRPPALRVDASVQPTRGVLDLFIDPVETRLRGSARYDFTLSVATPVLWLNGVDLTVPQATLDGTPATVVAGDEDFFGLALAAPLGVGQHVVEVRFEAGIDHARSRGVYAEKEGELSYAYTFFEPIDARRAFPCFDQPSVKIPWALTLHAKAGQLARANTPLTRTEPEADGWVRFEFAPSRPLPSYLVAFMVGPFDDIDAGPAGRAQTPLHFIVPKGRAAELAFARSVSPAVVAALEGYFDMNYPYTKLDVAVVPRFWGTMEHPGLVAMGQPLTLIKPEELTRERKRRYTNILAHELAHYWFGDLVTTSWWDDTWLNESMGSWLDPLITDTALPELRVRDDAAWGIQSALTADELASSHPIRRAIETRADIGESFDNDLTYAKGASVLRMFEASVGAERWQRFIRQWVRAHEDRTATAEDFFAEARAQLGDDTAVGLTQFFTTAGAPRIEAEVRCEGSPHLTLRQTRAAAPGVELPAATWRVPVCFRAGDSTQSARTCVTLEGASRDVPLAFCPSWVLINDGPTGNYRSALTGAQARALLEGPSAKRAALTLGEHVAVLNDLEAAVGRGDVPLDDTLRLIPSLLAHRDERVAALSFDVAVQRESDLPPELVGPWRAWRQKLCLPLATKLGWARAAGDSDDREALRARVLGCALAARTKPVVEAGAAAFGRWDKDRARAGLPADLLPLAMNAAMLKNEAATFERLLVLAKTTTDRQERGRFLGALFTAESPALAARARALALSSEFDLRETWGVVPTQLSMRATRDEAWRWLEVHLDELLEKMRGDEGGWLLSSAAGAACDANRRAQAEALLMPRATKVEGAADYTRRALESVDRCIVEQTRTRPALARFLESR